MYDCSFMDEKDLDSYGNLHRPMLIILMIYSSIISWNHTHDLHVENTIEIVYLTRCYSQNVLWITFIEFHLDRWCGKEVSYRHLKVFGCLAYVHIAKGQRGKRDPKSRSCIFLGYGEDQFGYQLWDLIDKNVIRSRDIVFIEEKTIIDWEAKMSGSLSHPTRREQPDMMHIRSARSRI